MYKSNEVKNGRYKKYKYFIVDGKYCPLAYVALPEKHPYWKNPCYIICHGGVSYSGKHQVLEENVIGWSYDQTYDYTKPMAEAYKKVNANVLALKKWTQEEIEAECRSVIDQISEVYDEKVIKVDK